jgi:MazG family protein
MTHIDSWRETEEAFAKLCATIAALRHPTTGCPWDLEQTHSTLRKYMLEEAYEAVDVMEPADPVKLQEELGDVLLQVVLNAQLAKDAGTFTIKDVIEGLDSKMRRRHPHVFGDSENPSTKTSREKTSIRAKWDEVKAAEKLTENSRGKVSQKSKSDAGVFSNLKSGNITPASRLAVNIGKIAKKIDFDWLEAQDVLQQLESEVSELKSDILSAAAKESIAAEMGDVYFCLSQLCRHLDLDPELCAIDGNKKFLNRFAALEEIARKKNIDVNQAGTTTLEKLWQEAKQLEKKLHKKVPLQPT